MNAHLLLANMAISFEVWVLQQK